MRKYGLFCFAIMVSVMLIIAGCSGGDDAGGAEGDTGGNGDNVVTITMGVSGDAQEKQLRYETGDLFMEENPNIEIEWVDIDGDRYETTLTLVSGGNSPDILYINDYMRPLAERDVLLPLDDFIEGDPDFDLNIYYDHLIDALRHDGVLYGLPQEVSPMVYYYNKELFDELGLNYPTDDWTEDDFFDAAIAIANSADNRYAGIVNPSWLGSYGTWIYRHGGDLFNEGYTESALDSPEVLNGLQAMQRMVDEGLSPNPAEQQAMGQGEDAMFRNQQVGMIHAGLWFLPSFKDEPLEFEWDVAKFPVAQNQDTHAGVLNWSISAEADHPEEAWEVVKFFVGEEGMRVVADYNMALPSGEFDEANQMVIDSGFPENVEAFIDAAPEVRYPEFHHSQWAEINSALGEQLDLMLLGEQTPEETQENMYREMNAILGVE